MFITQLPLSSLCVFTVWGTVKNELALTELALRGLALTELVKNELALEELALRGFALTELVKNELALEELALRGFVLTELVIKEHALSSRRACSKMSRSNRAC